MLETNDYTNWSQTVKEVKMDEQILVDKETEYYVKLHPEANRYSMGKCPKCNKYYIPKLGHKCEDEAFDVKPHSPGSEDKLCKIKTNIAMRAEVALMNYTDRYHKLP